jgi:hypothetical protein
MSRNNYAKRSGQWVRVALCALAVAASCTALTAQQQPDKATSPQEGQDVKPAGLAVPSYSQNVALLGTDQRYLDLGTLQTRRRTFFMYGMGLSESYLDNFQGSAGSADSSEFLWSPHIAIVNASNHSSFSIQYAPSVIQSTSGPSIHEVFQDGAISFAQPITRNWLLQLNSTNTYGTDVSRLLSPLGFDVNKGVPIADPGSAVFQFNRGKVFTTGDRVGLTWQRSPSQSLNFSAQESYFEPFDGGSSSKSTFIQASFNAAVSPRTTFNIGGNYYRQTYSVGGCDGYGFTAGVSHQFGRYITLALEGGPEFETAPCNRTVGGNYALTISYPLSRRSRLGATASRSYMTNYLPNTQWSDTGTVSYARQLSESVGINLNSGYDRSVRTLASSAGTYVGYFVGAGLSWNLSRTLSLRTEYRRFAQVSGGPNQGQNVALFSIGWNPLPMRIVR